MKELFSRLVFNILCGNTDDHAAFRDGKTLTLTPAYDICPQGRSGNEASQAMLISGGNNLSRSGTCLETAHNFCSSRMNVKFTESGPGINPRPESSTPLKRAVSIGSRGAPEVGG